MSEGDDYSRFVRPAADEEIHQSPPAAVGIGTSPDDGLPMMVSLPVLDQSPPLTEETLVCMADKRSFVVRTISDGQVLVTFKPEEVTTIPSGDYVVSEEAFMRKLNEAFPEQRAKTDEACRLRVSSMESLEDHIECVYVRSGLRLVPHVVARPIRPACIHYLRMQTDLAADRDARFFARACMLQRDSEGEYYSVRDTLVSACNIRSPRHFESEALLDDFDQKKIAEARSRQNMESFDVDAELAKEKPGSLGVLG